VKTKQNEEELKMQEGEKGVLGDLIRGSTGRGEEKKSREMEEVVGEERRQREAQNHEGQNQQ